MDDCMGRRETQRYTQQAVRLRAHAARALHLAREAQIRAAIIGRPFEGGVVAF